MDLDYYLFLMLRIIRKLLLSVSLTINHQLAIRIINKALLIFTELHKLFIIIELLIDSYVVHSFNLSLITYCFIAALCVSVIVLFTRNSNLYSVIR